MIQYKEHKWYVELIIDEVSQGNYDTKEEAHREAMRILGY